MTNSSEYTPSKVWTWNYPNSGRFATINRPINPFIPVHLARQTWSVPETGTAIVDQFSPAHIRYVLPIVPKEL